MGWNTRPVLTAAEKAERKVKRAALEATADGLVAKLAKVKGGNKATNGFLLAVAQTALDYWRQTAVKGTDGKDKGKGLPYFAELVTGNTRADGAPETRKVSQFILWGGVRELGLPDVPSEPDGRTVAMMVAERRMAALYGVEKGARPGKGGMYDFIFPLGQAGSAGTRYAPMPADMPDPLKVRLADIAR